MSADNRTKLYNALKSEGYTDIGSSQEEFNGLIENPNNLRLVYDALKTSGYTDIGKDYAEFEGLINPHYNPIAAQNPQAFAPEGEEIKPEQIVNRYGPRQSTQGMFQYGMAPITMGQAKDITDSYAADKDDKEHVTGLYGGVKQGTDALVQGNKYAAGEIANAYYGGRKDAERAIEKLESGEELKENESPWWRRAARKAAEYIPGVGNVVRAVNTAIDLAPEFNEDERANKIALEALEEAGGDKEKAKQILEEKAAKDSWGDRMKEEANAALAEHKPTKGAAAWVGNLLPQMAGIAAAMGIGSLNPAAGAVVGYANMAALTGSTMGASMREAREAGATDEQVWAAGLADAVIEMATEQIPFSNYTNRIFGAAKSKITKELLDAIANNPKARKEMQQLLAQASEELGGNLLGKSNVADYFGDVLAEGGSEFVAGALQTMTPMLYQNPENYPTITEIIRNGGEGLAAGLFMGSILGGASKKIEYDQNRSRRKAQGFVRVAEIHQGEKVSIGEVVGDDGSGKVQVLIDGKVVDIPKANIKKAYDFSFAEFDRAAIDTQKYESYDAGYATTDAQGMASIKKTMEDARAAISFLSDEAVQRLDENPVPTLELMESEGATDEELQAVRDYVNASAAYKGMVQRMNEEADEQTRGEQERLTAISNEEGMVQPVVLDNDTRAYVQKGTLDDEHIVVVDDNGVQSMVAPSTLRGVENPYNAQESIQAMRDEYVNARLAELDNPAQQTTQPVAAQYNYNDEVTILDDNNQPVRATIASNADGDGRMQVETETPVNGKRVNYLTAEEINGRLYEAPGESQQSEQSALAKEAIPMEKVGKEERPAYHLVPFERTLEELHGDADLTQQDIDAFITANITELQGEIKKVAEKEPKMGANIAKFKQDKIQWAEKQKALQAKLDYYNELKKRNAELNSSELQEAYNAPGSVEGVTTPDEVVAGLLGSIKITPESFKRETGLSTTEQKGLVGIIANEDKGGVSVERAAEIIAENYSDELAASGYTGDVQGIRNMLISVLSDGNPRTYAKRGAEQRANEEAENRRREIEAWVAQFDMTVEEYFLYEQTMLPRVMRDYQGFDENEYYSILADEYNNSNYDTERESESVGRGREVLQGEQPVPARGAEPVGAGNEGGAVPSDVQGGTANGVAQEEIGQPVGISEQLENGGQNALQNGANELNLQQENEQNNVDETNISRGGQVSQSVPQGEHRTQTPQIGGMEETAARLRERIEAYERTPQSGLSRDVRQVENRVTREYAQENGLWIPFDDVYRLGVTAISGNEHNNYLDEINQRINKVNNRMNTPSILDLLDRMELHNKHFPESKYYLIGFTAVSDNGDVWPVFSQRYIPNAREASIEEIDAYMSALGFTPVGEARYTNGEIVVKDLRPRNVLADADGDIYVVDAEFEPAKQESGENGANPTENAPEWLNKVPDDGRNFYVYIKLAGEKKFAAINLATGATVDRLVRASMVGKEKLQSLVEKLPSALYEGAEFQIRDAKGNVYYSSGVINAKNEETNIGYNYELEQQTYERITSAFRTELNKGGLPNLKTLEKYIKETKKSIKVVENGLAVAGEDTIEKGFETLAILKGRLRAYTDFRNEVKARLKEADNSSSSETPNSPTVSQESEQVGEQDNAPYTIAPAQYTTKKGKVLDMHLVKFAGTLTKEQQRAAKELAKADKGWYDREQGGFMMRSEESAKQLADTILNNDDAVSDAQTVSMTDIQALNNGDVAFTEPKQDNGRIWQYSIHVDKDGYTTISRDDVSSGYPIGDARFRYSTDSPEEMLDILRNPLNGMQEALEAVGVTLENKIKTRNIEREAKEKRRREYEALRENGVNGYKIGEKVIYTPASGTREPIEATIHDFEEFGAHNPVLNVGMAPVIYEVAEWSDISKVGATVEPQKVNVESLFGELNKKGEAKLSDHVEQPTNPSGNRLVTDERYAELRERMRKKLGGQMNIGIDPEILAIGTEMAVYHLEKGARKFTEYAKAMIADLGDAIRPYLKAFYNGARELPEVAESGLANDMTPYDEVQRFDVTNFDKQGIDVFAAAETIVREQGVAQEVEVAQERIKKTRSAKKETKKKSVTSQQNLLDLFDNGTEDENTRTDNSGAQSESQKLPNTEQVGARTSIQHPAKNSESKRGNSGTGRNKFGDRPWYDVNKNYSNEEIGEIVSSITDIVDGKVVITGEITDDIKAIIRGYKSGGVAKQGRGILDEYYTDGKIVDAVNMLIAPYFKDAKGVRVLEPSVGVGNFIEAVDNIPTSEIQAFEINDTTARIAKILYPNIDVNLRSFETEFIDESGNKKPLPKKFNLVIGNPPYGSHRGLYKGLGEESKIARYEDYFVKRSLDVLNDGGVLAMVLPSSWIDRHTKYGGYTIEAAYRLPSGAFEATQVGTDIVILKKDSTIPVTEHTPYFEQHPERVLGDVKERTGRYGRTEQYVEGNIDTALETIKREHAEQLAEQLDIEKSNDNLNDIEAAIEETGSIEKATPIVESEKAERKPAKKSSKPSKCKVELNRGVETVPTSSQFTHEFSEGEVEAFADTEYDGTLNNPTRHKKYANYIGGRAVHDFYYAEGDIYDKLAQLEREKGSITAAYGIEQYNKQKRLLESVLPKRKELSEITVSPNTTFVKNLNIETAEGSVSLKDAFIAFCRKLPHQAFGDSSSWEVVGYVNNEQVHGTDKHRNQRVRERRKRVANDLFAKFLNEELSDKAKNQVVAAFNSEYNSVYRPDYSKVPMFSTINKIFKDKPLKLTDVQLAGIGRMTVKGVGVLAHEVGFGKTLSGILAMHEAMTRGFAKKPLIVVPNDNILKQWVETINEVLPQATVNTLGNLGTGYDLTDFKVNDGEFTIVTYEGLKAMSFSDDTYNRLAERFSYITEDLKKHQSERDIQKEIEKHNELKGKMKRGAKATYGFEDFGFDWLTVDEVHNANHIVSKVRLDKSVASDFRSQSQRTSDLGLKTWLAAQYIQEENNGRNVLLLSATPFTNKPLEYYSILSLVGNKMLERKGFFNVDQFFATFMEADNEMEMGANNRPVQKTNVRRFRNNGLFQQLLSEFIDIKGEEDNPELIRPTRHNREYKLAQNDLTAQAIDAAQELLNDNDTVLQGITHARAAAFSPYATPLLGAHPKGHKEFVKNSPKIDATIKMIEQNRKDRPDAGQIIYSEVGVEFFPMIRDYLVKESGFKPNEVRIITGATSNNERVNIQTAFNNGEVKVVIGSPAIKEGLNLQGNTTDMYILSLPWNFTQLRQIEGRGWRQGNKWENIRINYMLTNNSVDVFMLQRLQLKQGLYNEAMKSGAESLDVSDIDTAELKTALITDPAVRAEIVTAQEREKLQMEKTQIEADLSFVVRKYEAYNKLISKLDSQKRTVKQYREWAKNGDNYWVERAEREEAAVQTIEQEIEQEKENLAKKGVNVDDIVRQTEQAQSAIAAIQERIDNLKEFQQELTERFRKENEAKEKLQGDVLATYLKERKAENNSGFYKIRPKEKPKTAEEGDVLYRTKETAPETASVRDEHQPTVVSSADGAKVLKDLDNAIIEYENKSSHPKTLLGDIAKVLGAKKHGSNSQYATFEAVNGKVFTIRLANHNATVSTFDNHDENEGISIVVTAQGNNGITNDGNAHIVEFFYDAIKLRKADGKPLVEILKSIKQALYSGEYRDTTGLAIREEVNSDILSREGYGPLTDSEVATESDVYAKALGRPRYTGRKMREYVAGQRQKMVERVNELAEKLHLDNVEVVTEEGKTTAKGFYSKSTGKITIVIPNHSSAFDVEQTLLHEAVAHYGLRQLFGEHFDAFLDNVYYNASEEIRAEIDRLAMEKYDGETRTATEEYLASLAENTNFENAERSSWWQKIKRFFVDMLAKAGVKLDAPLTDNELRYILWRSYENLAEPGRYRSIIGEAADIAKQYDLGVGNYAPVQASGDMVAERDVLNREGTPATEEFINATVVASNWGNTHKGAAPCIVIQSAETLRAQLEQAGFSAEDIADAEKDSNSCSAEYFPTADKVVIYNINAVQDEIIGYLWHENAHKAIGEIYTEEEVERAFKAVVGEFEQEVREQLAEMGYAEKQQAEEYFVQEFERMWLDENTRAMLERGRFSAKESAPKEYKIFADFIKPIIKYINNGGERGYNPDGGIRESVGENQGGYVGQHQESLEVRNSTTKRGTPKAKRGTDKTGATLTIEDGQKGETNRSGTPGGGILGRNGQKDTGVHLRNAGNESGETRKGIKARRGTVVNALGTASALYENAVRRKGGKGYQEKVAITAHKLQEAYQDSMLALDELQKAITAETGNVVETYEDAYMAENAMSSRNRAEIEAFERDFYNPLIAAVGQLVNSGASYDDVKTYMHAKHGLERNRVFSKRDVENAGNVWDGEVKRDYSGLTALTGEKTVKALTAKAEHIVAEFEANHDTEELWRRINAATKQTLRKGYESGMMNRETYERVRDMFEYYIPLRGWDTDVAADEYEYLNSPRPMLPPALKTAEGRKSISDDPVATIAFMANAEIVRGNRNVMKQHFFNLVLNNPTSVATVSEQWYTYNNAKEEWNPDNPVIPIDATADEIDAILKEHEQKMRELQEQGLATRKRSRLNLGLHTTKYEGQEHVVRVMRGGKEFCIYINGNPRAAQAINGMTNPNTAYNTPAMRFGERVKNFQARAYTSLSPMFIFTNLSRDVIMAGTAVAIKENGAYTKQYSKNITKALTTAMLPKLVKKYKAGKLDMNIEEERYFNEFVMNGGETGFTRLLGMEDYKKDLEKKLQKLQGKQSIAGKAFETVADGVEFMNRSVEDTTRFMVYMTSRQMGRDVRRSIWDAKEITVNFNKKGSGGFLARELSLWYIFFNAAVQSVANFGKLMAKNPGKTTVALAAFSSAGMLVPLLNMTMQALLGDDDELEYWDLPEWVRRNNLVIWLPGGYVTIPLPHELRPFYGMGEATMACILGKAEVGETLGKVALGFSDMLPLDFTGNGGNILVNLMPTISQPIVQVAMNVDYFGKPVYRNNDWNKEDPEWTKAYKGTSTWLVNGTKWLNEISGGNNIKSGYIDLNPAWIEHLFESYTGGMGKTFNKMMKTVSMLWNEDAREVRNVPVVSSFYQTSEERTVDRALNEKYHKALEELYNYNHLMRGYKKEAGKGLFEYAKLYSDLVESNEYKRAEIIKYFKKRVDEIEDYLENNKLTPEERTKAENDMRDAKLMMFDELDNVNK